MFLYLKCCFSEKLEQRPVDDMQKYEDDMQTTCRHHIMRGFCRKLLKIGETKIAKKNPGGQNRKKIPERYSKQDIFLPKQDIFGVLGGRIFRGNRNRGGWS